MTPQPTEGAPDWAAVRDRFPVTRNVAYMNCGWQGPMSRETAEAMRARIDLELEHGATSRRGTEHRMELAAALHAAFARLLGADVEEVAVTSNTTEGVNIAVNGVAVGPGDGVVTTSAEHGGGLVPAYWARERRGADLRIVPVDGHDDDATVLERFDRAIDARTRLVIVSHVSYSNGRLLPLPGIAELARARGATVVVDGAQTAGHLPLDMHALGVDAYAVPAQKWLCGPSGIGALYVRRDRIASLEPDRVSGRAAAAYDFEGSFEPKRDDIHKFELATLSAPAMAGARAAAEQYLEWGPEAAWQRILGLARCAEAAFAPIDGVRIVSPRDDAARSGLFVFSIEGRDPAPVAAWLQSAGGIVCRTVRQYDAVRLSLHVYNTEDEVERAASMVARVAAGEVPEEELAQAGPRAEEA